MNRKILSRLSTTHKILLSFLIVILMGSVLLVLPASSANGRPVSYIDALFTAATSVCVTGLVTLPTCSAWSDFGQAVILALVQIGGLGVITFLSGLMISLHRGMKMSDRLLIQDSLNLNTLSGITRFIKRVFIGTFLIEIAGAVLYMFVFVPEYGARGIWISFFTSISAFCNAGLDILSPNSLCQYRSNDLVQAVTCLLIVLGGIGYIVWWDFLSVFKRKGRSFFKKLQRLTLHSKIVLSATAFLILFGALAFFVLESRNPLTIRDFSTADKIRFSFFQSITARTAGFATVPQENLTHASAILMLVLMFIGASPVGTAGGVKTVTIAVLLASAFATLQGKDDVTLFNRTVSRNSIKKAISIVFIAFLVLILGSMLLAAATSADGLDVIFETVSAIATVGLSRNLTGSLNTAGKIIIICAMYLGRVGPISFFLAFNRQSEKNNLIKNPVEEISVG